MKMQKNLIIAIVVTAVVAGGVGYCAGARPSWLGGKSDKNRLLTAPNGDRFQQFGDRAGAMMGGTAKRIQGNGMIAGEIISKDDKTITLKDPAGGSKIIFFSDKTAVAKTTEGSLADLTVGASIIVTGTTNADGSVAAANIQIRPFAPAPEKLNTNN